MPTQIDLRQSLYRGLLNQLANITGQTADHLIAAANNQLTPLLRMSAAASPSLVVSIGGGDLTDAETNRRRAIPHVGTAYVQFASGTVTFPAASGGTIVCSPGNNTILTVGVGNYAAVLIYLDGTGALNALQGAEDAVLNTAITNLPPSPDDTLPLGFVIVHNTAGVIDNITQANIAQFGTGAGGGGSGNVTAVESALRDYNNFAGTKYLDPNIFRQAKATKVDGSSTGAFDLVKNAFKFTSIGQTFVSTNLANAEFLAEGVDITDAHLYLHWLLGFIDTAATYEASRDGGTNWQTIDMVRVGTASNAYRGYLQFEDEVTLQSLVTVAATGAGQALNATTQQELGTKFTFATTSVIREIDLEMNFGGAGVGNFYVSIVKDDSGSPSTDLADLIAESNAVSIPTLSTGNITVTVEIPSCVLVAGDYHIVLRTDAAYKAGTLDLSWREGAGTLGSTYNGTTWTAGASSKAHVTKGRAHDLRIRVTAGTANTFMEGMGVYFPSDDGITQPNGSKQVQRFYFTGDENRTVFELNWVAEPDLLEILDPYRGQSYAIEPGVAKISGQTITFASDTFNFPGEDIVLIFRQVKGIAIDNSDFNAAKNSEQDENLLDIGDVIADLDFVTIPKITVPNTQIQNRSQIPDLSQDLGARMGINRLMTQQIYKTQDEFGPNGQLVYKSVNDRLNQIRFVGTWLNQNSDNGIHITSVVVDDFIEITFYGTGLNILGKLDGARDWRASVDGGAEGANFINFTGSAEIASRNYSPNQIAKVVSGLSLGLHTVKIRHASGNVVMSGFEILNESSAITINPGSQFVEGLKRTLGAQQSVAYNSSFETGTLSTRGGRVIVYQKADGSIAKAVQPTDSSQANLALANHANEEIARTYNFREFGAGRADDFSSLTSVGTSDRAFTLEDGTTTLVGEDVSTLSTSEGVFGDSTSGYVLIVFVGTGLDVINASTTVPTDPYTIVIDGTVADAAFTSWVIGRNKIVSGLPYGTHTVKLQRNSGANSPVFRDFLVYQPKTPTVPTGSKLLYAYNIMADFSASGVSGTTADDHLDMYQGVLHKSTMRESIYSGTWIAPTVRTTLPSGFFPNTTTNSSYIEYSFFGTGIAVHMLDSAGGTVTYSAAIDGVLTAGATNLISVTDNGGGSYTTTTTTGNQPARLVFSGLSLGLHTIRLTRTAGAGGFAPVSFYVITPIHAFKSNLYADVQNSLPVGSQTIEDFRKVDAFEQISDQKAWSQALGIIAGPSTTSTIYVPIPDMSVTHFNRSGRIRISYHVALNTGTGTAQVIPYVNGVEAGKATYQINNSNTTVADTITVPVSPGFNKIDLYWLTASGTVSGITTLRSLLVEEA